MLQPAQLAEEVVMRLPPEVREVLRRSEGGVVVAGGMVRDVALEVPWRDVDLFGQEVAPPELEEWKTASTEMVTEYTMPGDVVVQYIQTAVDPWQHVMGKFDFTCCQAAVGWMRERWTLMDSWQFWDALETKTLWLSEAPIYVKNALARVLKMVGRGWTIQKGTLAQIIAAMVVDCEEGFLRRVDKERLALELGQLMVDTDVPTMARRELREY